MISKMRFSLTLTFIGLISGIQSAYATLLDDSNTIFNWAEGVYSDLFIPAGQPTATLDPWYFRFYPTTQIYLGVNTQGEIYVMGGQFGNEPFYVGTVDNYLAQATAASNTGNTSSGGNSAGNGNCVTLPYPTTGLQANYSVTADGATGNMSVTYTSTSPTQAISETTSSFGGSSVSSSSSTTTTQYYNIIDGYLYVDSVETVISTTVPGAGSFNDTTTTSFSPAHNEGPAVDYCEQQSWTSDSVTQTSTTVNFGVPGGAVSSSTAVVTGLVESVNESVTVPAGTFNTVKVRETESGEETISWYSISDGIFVKVQTLNGTGVVTSESVLTSTN